MRLNILFKLGVFLLSFMITGNTLAQEITAVNFNGDLIGKVIPDGKVVGFDNQIIGNVTADSLILDFDGNLIGGVIPQGIAIGNDNKLLGKVNNDGSVRLASGKIIGKALPNGLVIDDAFNIIGSVLFPGIIYDDNGNAAGRLAGDGSYINMQGQTIGFVSPDGYAYRNQSGDVSLEGRLISSKMVISNDGEFIGSIVPGGKVTDFEAKEIGKIKANGFVSNVEGKIIGHVVKSGYAFDYYGKYLGFVTYNGEVIDKDQLKGRLNQEGHILDTDGAVVGYMLDIAATATDNNGRYLGRIMPKGEIAKGKEIIGKAGANGVVFDNDNNIIGQITNSGPVFDYKGKLIAHAFKSGGVISPAGNVIGSIKGSHAFDGHGNILGAVLDNVIAVDFNNNIVGVPDINASVKYGEDIKTVSPFGYLFSSDGRVEGNVIKLSTIFGLTGNPVAQITANGELLNKGLSSIGKLLDSGFNFDDRNRVLGKFIHPQYVVDNEGESFGNISGSNLVLSKDNAKFIGKILPDNAVVADISASLTLAPKIGEASSNIMGFGFDGNLLGIVNADGSVKDFNGSSIGRVVNNSQIIDNNGSLIGGTMGYEVIVDDSCNFIGVVGNRGDIRDFRDVGQGKILLNGQIINDAGKVSGHKIVRNPVIDFNGNSLGAVSSAGTAVNYNNENLGCINKRGMLKNAEGTIYAGISVSRPVINFNNEFIGRSLLDSTVVDDNSQIIGNSQPNGNVNSKTGVPVGNLFNFKVAFDNQNKYLGRVLDNGTVIDDAGQNAGTVDFNGFVISGEQEIGYALYDLYIYDNDFNAIGYIAKDGNIMSFTGANIGRVDRGFMLDRDLNIIGRGNRDFYIRDSIYNTIGELQMDGKVLDLAGNLVGNLEKDGAISNADGIEIAYAKSLQYYDSTGSRRQVYDESCRLIGFAGSNDIVVNEQGKVIGILKDNENVVDGNANIIGRIRNDCAEVSGTIPQSTLPEVGVTELKEAQEKSRRSFNIALTPDGEYLGEILDDGRVVDDNGNVLGRRMPDGLIIDDDGTLIGIEEVKKPDDSGMFVPAGTFGKGGAYGTGVGPGSNLGPGGGYGPGERYDPSRAAALAAAQDARRKSIAVGKISSNVRKEAFDYMQKDWGEQGTQKVISSWRVDMTEVILADKPIPAVISRSIDSSNPTPVTAYVERNVYGEDGRNVLIPSGSRLIGTLGGLSGSSEATSESAKVSITWERLIRPDGVMFVFQGITGDAQGRGGALGYLDQQLFKRYSLPILTSVLTSYSSYLIATQDDSTGEVENSRQQAANDARQNFINDMNNVFSQILEDKADIKPLTYVPSGTRIIVYPNVDLWLRTEERDAEASIMDVGPRPLINDPQRQDQREEAANAPNQTSQVAASSGDKVVYDPNTSDAQAVGGSRPLISDRTSRRQQQTVPVGAPPPPPSSSNLMTAPASTPSSTTSNNGGSSSSSSSSSSSNVPQLF